MKDEDTKTASLKIDDSEAKMAQVVNSLLEPLKMRLYPSSHGWLVANLGGEAIMMYTCSDDMSRFAETFWSGKNGLDRILEVIKTAKRWTFGDFAKSIGCKDFDNPYFGCKTLEEMLIKKDLLDDR